MNLKFLSHLIIAIVFCANNTYAQLHKVALGGSASYTSYGGDYHTPNLAVGLRFCYNFFPKTTITFGFNSGLPITDDKATVVGIAKKTNTTPAAIYLKADQHFSIKTFYLNYNFFLIHDNEHPLGMYMLIGTTFTAVSMSYDHIAVYDQEKYSLQQYTSSKIGGFGLTGGLGGQIKHNQFIFFFEGQLGMPLNVFNSDKQPYDIPFTGTVTAGAKIQLGPDRVPVGGQRRKPQPRRKS